MASLTGETSTYDINLTGESVGYFSNIITDQLQNQDIALFTGIDANIQTQIDNINTQISGGYSGGGNFTMVCQQNTGYTPSNYWTFGQGGATTVYNPVICNFEYTATRIYFTTTTTPTTGATVQLRKNNTSIASFTLGTNTSFLTTAFSYTFTSTDELSIFTTAGAGGGVVRAVISCATNGVIGPAGTTPSFSVGTVSNTPTTLTITQTGTLANPVLNFNIPPGPTGPQGPQGPPGVDSGDYYTKIESDNIFATKSYVDIAVAGVATATATALAGIETELAGIETEIVAIGESITGIEGQITILQTQTQNQTAVEGETAFAGMVSSNQMNTDVLEITTSINGLGSLNLASTGATHNLIGGEVNITAPLINVKSQAGFGVVNIGNASDTVYIQNVPFTTLLFNQWKP